MKNLEEKLAVKHLAGGSAIATVTGTGLDTKGYSEAMVLLSTGTVAGAGTLDVKIQDSADNSSWADVTGAAFAQIVGADDNVVKIARLKLDGNLVRRYIRAVTVVAVATADHTVLVVMGHDQYPPANTIAFTK